MSKFWNDIISPKSTKSSKRFVTLLISGLFMLTQCVIIFTMVYVLFYIPKGKVDPAIMQFMLEIMRMDFYIILLGLTFITGDQFVSIFKEKAELAAAVIKKKEEDDDGEVKENPEIKE